MRLNFFLFLFLFCCQINNLAAQSAKINFQIIDKTNGALTPARLTILKEGKPIVLELESKLNIVTRSNIIYTASGTGTFSLETGDYEFWFSKGMEYTIDVQQIHVENEKEYFLSSYLERAINTDGFICGDMHLHTLTNSGHGDANLIERVISCAAEGLEWVVATDHNYVTDYTPYMEQAGLLGKMATTVGNEVNNNFGHFNIFPIDTLAKQIDKKTSDANVFFESIRFAVGNEVLIQANHPREYDPFFSLKGLDIYFGTVKDPEWSWDFDALEVLNANSQKGWVRSRGNQHSVVRDWYNMLNHNIRISGVGNSDSHKVINNFAGVPRNYIRSSSDSPTGINEKEIIMNIKAQQVVVACGLFPRILIEGKDAMGKTFSVINKPVNLQLQVQAAPWLDCSRAELVRNGVVVQSFDLSDGRHEKGVMRLDTIVSLKPEKDSWYLLVAHGDKDMYPLVGTPEEPSYPSGFTNPVWIKANNEKNFQSLFDLAKIKTQEKGKDKKELVTLLKKEPEFIPYVFFHLFDSKHKNALNIVEAFFDQASTEHRLILFRELAKTDLPGAQKALEKLQENDLTAYEEVTLGSYIHFPIRESRVNQFKKRNLAHLDDFLNFLEIELSYIHSKGSIQKAKVGYSINETQPDIWVEKAADSKAVFNFSKKGSGNNFLKTNWRMIKDTSLIFYLKTDQQVQIWANGVLTQTIFSNTSRPVEEKLISLQLKKGTNEIILQCSAEKEAHISFLHASKALLIDPNIKLDEVEHLALNADAEYLTEYNYKYHGHGVALTDGYRGTTDYSNQLWQGWFGENAEIIIDLGAEQLVEEVSIGLLSRQSSWIFFPKKIEYFTSVDGINFDAVYEETFDKITKIDATVLKTHTGKIKSHVAKYVKVLVTPIVALPEWHKSKGAKAWVFLDEIMVK